MTVALREKIALTVRLRLESANSGRPLAGLAVRLDEEVRVTDETGWATFTTALPAAAPGRWVHLRFTVHPGVAEATNATDRLLASRLTLPTRAYAESGVARGKSTVALSSLTTDAVFAEGGDLMMAAMTGDVRRGFTASRTVRI